MQSFGKIIKTTGFISFSIFLFICSILAYYITSSKLLLINNIDYLYSRDINQMIVMSLAVKEGISPYQNVTDLARVLIDLPLSRDWLPHASPYPPTVALLFYPFTYLSFGTFHKVWHVFSFFSLLLGTGCLIHFSSINSSFSLLKKLFLFYICLIVVLLGPGGFDLFLGQCSSVVFFLFWISLYLYNNKSLKLSGVVTAIIILIRLDLILVAVYFATRKKSRNFLFGFLGTTLILLLGTYLIALPSNILKEYIVAHPRNISFFWSPWVHNVSLTSVPYKLLSPSFLLDGIDSRIYPKVLPNPTFYYFIGEILSGISILLFGIYLLINRRNSCFILAAAVAISVLIRPVVWYHMYLHIISVVSLFYFEFSNNKKTEQSYKIIVFLIGLVLLQQIINEVTIWRNIVKPFLSLRGSFIAKIIIIIPQFLVFLTVCICIYSEYAYKKISWKR